ncbi:MAG: protein kinase [Planctomycetota bacterium]|nr:protein kinase [Planctomycetota bacterium]
MPTTTLHPLEAKFVKLALIRQMIRPSQLRRCHQIHQHRHGLGEAVTLEQVMQQEGLITEDECEELWELIAQSSDTRVRNELSSRRESRPRPSDAARNASRLAGAPEELKGYRLLEMIGSGGMGKVYKARQIAMERDVALKLLPPDLAKNGKYIRRFIREARAAGMLNHANLVRVYDVGEADGRYYISMEYVEGRTVKQYIRREGRVPFLEALKIIEQVAAALDCAHQHKIVHRDIKPDNIMLSPRGDVKLCDLGLAKILEGSLQDTDTQDGQTMGTPHYMSPEQAKAAGDLDGRSDLFSLGATLYHMVTGKVPFDGESSWEILMKVTGEEPVRPDRLEPLLPPPYTRMIQRLMAKSPAERYQNAEEVRLAAQNLRRDLEAGRLFVFDDAPRMLRGQPVPAPTPWRRLPRRPWLAGLAAALAFVLLAALAGRRGSPAAAPLPDAPLAVLSAEAPRVPDAVPDFPLPPAKPPELPEPPPAEPLLLADLASLRDLERRLEQDPLQWPMVLARLEALQPKLSRAAAADIERYQRLKDQVLAAREAQAEAEWKGRLDGAYALMEAGCFTRAAQTLEDVPPLLRGAKVVAAGLPEVLDLVRKSAVEDATARRRRIDELAREGLFEWSDADWRAWQDELKQDGAPAADPRALACREARESLERGKNTLEIKERAFDEARAEARQVLQNVAGLTRAHQFPQARAALEERLQKERSAVAQQLYAAELERLRLVQRLLEKARPRRERASQPDRRARVPRRSQGRLDARRP